MLRSIERIFSYVYHLALGLFLFVVGAIALFSSGTTVTMKMLPWEGSALTYCVLLGGLIGLLSLALAVTGKLRLLFRLWAIAVVVLMAYGFFFTNYGFRGAGDFFQAVLLTLGALVALIGAMRNPKRKRA